MKYINETSLRNFPAWSGGKDTLSDIFKYEYSRNTLICDTIEELIEETFTEQIPTDTDINDFLWFERDFIAIYLGYENYDEFLKAI